MPNDILHKIHLRAKKIRKDHPNMAWKAAIKTAGRDYRAGKISGTQRRKKTAPGHRKKSVAGTKKRIGEKPKYKVIHEVRRINGVTYKGGSVAIRGTEGVNRLKGELQAKYGEQLGWLDVAISSEKTKTGKNKLRKKRAELLRELHKISK